VAQPLQGATDEESRKENIIDWDGESCIAEKSFARSGPGILLWDIEN
jgi:hypothetical protein